MVLLEAQGPSTSGINFAWSPPDGGGQETRPPEAQASPGGLASAFNNEHFKARTPHPLLFSLKLTPPTFALLHSLAGFPRVHPSVIGTVL